MPRRFSFGSVRMSHDTMTIKYKCHTTCDLFGAGSTEDLSEELPLLRSPQLLRIDNPLGYWRTLGLNNVRDCLDRKELINRKLNNNSLKKRGSFQSLSVPIDTLSINLSVRCVFVRVVLPSVFVVISSTKTRHIYTHKH